VSELGRIAFLGLVRVVCTSDKRAVEKADLVDLLAV
jgi:hypothetical protein